MFSLTLSLSLWETPFIINIIIVFFFGQVEEAQEEAQEEEEEEEEAMGGRPCVTEYEQQREARLSENRKRMEALGLLDFSRSISTKAVKESPTPLLQRRTAIPPQKRQRRDLPPPPSTLPPPASRRSSR